MNKTLLFFAIFLFFSLTIFAQDSLIKWQENIGGSKFDIGNGLFADNDGCILLVGNTFSNDKDISRNQGGSDVVIVKLNKFGQKIWERTYGGTNSDGAYCIEKALDNGYIVAGYTCSSDGDVKHYKGGDVNGWVFKIDSNGILIWEESYLGGNRSIFNHLAVLPNGSSILGGFSYSNGNFTSFRHAIIVEIDDTGSIIWDKYIGNKGFNWVSSISLCKDSTCLISLVLDELSSIQKINFQGKVIWAMPIFANCINSTADGGFVTASNREINRKSYYTITKYSKDSTIVLQTTKPFILNNDSTRAFDGYFLSILEDRLGNYYLFGNSDSFPTKKNFNDFDLWVTKLDYKGNLIWTKSYGGSNREGNDDFGGGSGYYGSPGQNSMILTNDGGAVFIGYSFSNDGDVTYNNGDGDIWVVKLKGDSSTGIDATLEENSFISLYPNPAHLTFTLKIEQGAIERGQITITDITGRTMKTCEFFKTSKVWQMDISNLSKGIYFLKYQDGERVWNGKFVKQ